MQRTFSLKEAVIIETSVTKDAIGKTLRRLSRVVEEEVSALLEADVS